jgi:hypothetical protein
MEEQAASMAEARERELRAMGKLDEVRFERSDEDEIVSSVCLFQSRVSDNPLGSPPQTSPCQRI